MWTWSNFLHGTTAPGMCSVHINFDETSVCLFQGSKSGHMVRAALARRRSGDALTRDVKRGEARTNFTHVAFICDDPDIQVLLPQVIIVGEKTMPAQTAADVVETVPPPCVLLRCRNAWVTEDTMVQIAAELGERLAPFAATHAFTLFADSYKAHIGKRALRAFGRAHVRFCCIPAGLTWALQPCDTHVFALYKRRLREVCEDVALARRDGKVRYPDVINAVTSVVHTVLNGRSWARAFADLGLSGTQVHVSARLRRQLQLPSIFADMPAAVPDLQQLMHIFPRGHNIPVEDLFAFFTQRRHTTVTRTPRTHAPAHPRDVRTEGEVPDAQAWFGRTRSTSSQAAAPPTAASSSTAWRTTASVVARPEVRMPQIPFLPNAKRLPWPTVSRTEALQQTPTSGLPTCSLPTTTSSPLFNA